MPYNGQVEGKNMKALLRLLLIVVLAGSFASMAFAADVQGMLLDKMCSPNIVKANDQAGAKAHTRDCALMEDCAKAGYGVLTADGKFVNIDPAGKAKVIQALKASTKKNDLRVQVTGDLKGDTIKIASIKIL
jgi:hypothetical protein